MISQIKIIKGKSTEVIERDVNEFSDIMYNKYYESFKKFTIDDVKLMYNESTKEYIATVIYHVD